MYCFFFFKQKTAYEMRISDWSSDVCSSDLEAAAHGNRLHGKLRVEQQPPRRLQTQAQVIGAGPDVERLAEQQLQGAHGDLQAPRDGSRGKGAVEARLHEPDGGGDARLVAGEAAEGRSEEHTYELQSLMRTPYAD